MLSHFDKQEDDSIISQGVSSGEKSFYFLFLIIQIN